MLEKIAYLSQYVKIFYSNQSRLDHDFIQNTSKGRKSSARMLNAGNGKICESKFDICAYKALVYIQMDKHVTICTYFYIHRLINKRHPYTKQNL